MQIGLIGAGNMASALAGDSASPCSSPTSCPRRRRRWPPSWAARRVLDAEVAQRADVLLLCHKPAQLEEVARSTEGRARAVASILGATPIEALERAYPRLPVYRFLPSIRPRCGRE